MGVDRTEAVCKAGVKRLAEEELESGSGYGSGPAYWNKRYKKDPNPFEWLKGFEECKSLIQEAAKGKLDCDILHVGCGNSLLPEAMYDAGYHRIINIDTSSVCIGQMAARNRAKRPEMRWSVGDATAMALDDESFDVVLDKSVLDTFACGDRAPRVIATYLKEVQRVLRPGGVFLSISYGAPSSRLEYFRSRHLEFTVRQQPVKSLERGGSTHYAYVLTKPLVCRGAAAEFPKVLYEMSYLDEPSLCAARP